MKDDTKLPKTKICTGCFKRKPLEKFGVNKAMKYGRKSYCRICQNRLERGYRKKRAAKKKVSPSPKKEAAKKRASKTRAKKVE